MQIFKMALATAALALGSVAMAQGFPTKPITFLGLAPGGTPEAIQRAIFDKVNQNTGATLLWQARAGAGGAVGLQALKAAPADGYTMAITYASATTLNPLINPQLSIDALKDFSYVTNLFSVGVVLAAKDDFPAKDIRDLVAMAKAKPDTVRVGVFGAGNRAWLAMLEERTGTKFLAVPNGNTAQLITMTLGGHLDVHFETPGTVVAQAGKLKALSFGGAAQSPQVPGAPLVRDLYKFDMMSWFGIIAPAGTPQAAVDWVHREVTRAMKDPAIMKLIESNGFAAIGDTPEQFAKVVRDETEMNREIVRKYPDIK
ncbi:MAG: tripartite tricarboxylate transporter substrate binding protein [Rhodoferax sp.]|jgi:tripartite-type tricarboxylate transporter receptor subunit TctC|nr:tripartite tricarboxylate transporter substrate binding protein [Rhodoferax sp.]